jgi:hypothetical protein
VILRLRTDSCTVGISTTMGDTDMVFRVIVTNVTTGETFKATRRFPSEDAANAWAAVNVPRYEGERRWNVEPEVLPGSRE